jgi:tetratricopeptide (TPR) repeat protein
MLRLLHYRNAFIKLGWVRPRWAVVSRRTREDVEDMPDAPQEQVSKKTRELYNKGMGSLERGNLDYAIDVLFACVQDAPSFLQARKLLRAAEIKRFKRADGGFFGKAMATVRSLPRMAQITALLQAGKAQPALQAAEELMKTDPLNRTVIKLFAKAAEAANLPEAALQTLEVAREHYPTDDGILQRVGELYGKLGRTREARDAFEKLIELRPHDLAAIKLLKDSMAVDSMSSDGWQETADAQGTYREVMKDSKEAVLLEQGSKAVKSDKDTEALIAEMRAKIEAEPENINYYRGLARLCAQRKLFDDAIATLRKALEINPGDPELDGALTAVRLQQYDFEIERLTAAGQAPAAAAKTEERNRFYADDLQARVARYPNDLKLRYDLGVLFVGTAMTNEAIQQFQLSQRSPKHRMRSLYYLALCFKQKQQYDLALEHLSKARLEIPGMDEIKKDVCYEMGLIYELLGKIPEAGECYKQVYQVDIGYKDVAARVENVYSKM